MAEYTICPKLIEYSGINKKNIVDLLFAFIPENSKKICIDNDEKIIDVYKRIIEKDKDLSDWFRFLNMNKDSSFLKIPLKNKNSNLVLNLCSSSFSKNLISDSIGNYSDEFDFLQQEDIRFFDAEEAKIILNYGNSIFPPVDLSKFNPVTKENILDLVIEICNNFKDLIELNGLYKLLYEKNGKRVDEKKAQLLFYAVAFTYCSANDLKLCPEVNSGNGPVDFNISKGFTISVNVEIKFADNPKLKNGFWYQLRTYNQAERTNKSIYLVLNNTDKYDTEIKKIKKLITTQESKGMILPHFFEINYKEKPSASNQKE
ncbi:hypothetical protein [Chryseobacterium profundimaris]|uniref:Restriction endonuclease n=1 Tax=Chryseobacterium profundimaris TaxID=1387275 RepID=A0ABY1NIS3_9FLAO|nr:hypothetical protein [Chryseobacterium profundimaris]SMP10197.1 hypothetical protein SAMN06264346_102172 [Chryseobacterium profundimaris]